MGVEEKVVAGAHLVYCGQVAEESKGGRVREGGSLRAVRCGE